MKEKYVRFSPYSHVCCIHSHIISLPLSQICAYSAYIGDVVMWKQEWGAQKESFYFVVFNGMYVHTYINPIFV